MRSLFKYLQGDRVIWIVSVILAVLSLLAVYSAISSLAFRDHGGSTESFLFKHALMLASGFVLMYYAHRIPYKYYSRLSQLLIWLSVFLLFLTLLIGVEINQADRWLRIPIIGQNFQTSDLGKLALVAYLARVLSQRQDRIKDLKEGVLPALIPMVLVCGLILPADLSTAAMLFGISLILMFIARVALRHLFLIVGGAIAGLGILVLLSTAQPGLLPRVDTWKERIADFEAGEGEESYQMQHSKIAIATGGLIGKGPSKSTSRNFLPHPYSDMIYAFVIEEYGAIIGGAGVLLLFLILFYRSVRIATKCEKNFGSLLVTGLSLLLVGQGLVNMGVAVDLLPVTGQPLPLVSMGGTSIWFTCITIGIILSVSREVENAYSQEDEESS